MTDDEEDINKKGAAFVSLQDTIRQRLIESVVTEIVWLSILRDAAQDVTGNNESLNLVRSFVYGCNSDISVESFHGEFFGVAVSAEHLNSPVTGPLGRLGGEVFCHG